MRADTCRKLALTLPDAVELETWGNATFRVRNKIFAMFSEGNREVWIKSTHDEQRALVAMEPGTYFVPPYVGPSGWVGARIAKADRGEIEELLIEAWRMTATKRAVKAYDEGGG